MMNIWEEVYSRHKKGGLVPFDPQMDQNPPPQKKDQAPSDSDSLNQPTTKTANRSLSNSVISIGSRHSSLSTSVLPTGNLNRIPR
jgi:hypothetical protein